MAMVDLEGVYRVTAKGKTYYYAWRGKGAPRLKSKPGTPAFVEELARALSSRKTGETGKMSSLCALYRASDEWKGLADKTRYDWGRWLDRIQIRFGGLSVGLFGKSSIKKDIRIWRDQYKATPRAADMGIQVLSRLLSYAVDEGLIDQNQAKGIPKLYASDRSDLIWTAADFASLEAVASKEVFQAARLAALTGLRQGDLLRLSWSHVKENAIEMRTSKSGGKRTAVIPLYGELRDYLSTIKRRASTVLVTTEGRPWQSGFGASWGRAVRAAGLSLHFHDLRGTAATRFYSGGLTVREIAEVMGWSEDRIEGMLDRYVKRDELLLDRIRRMEAGNGSATETAKPAAKLS